MDKNTITGFVLMALVLFGFRVVATPSDEEIAQQRIEFVKGLYRKCSEDSRAKECSCQSSQQGKRSKYRHYSLILRSI